MKIRTIVKCLHSCGILNEKVTHLFTKFTSLDVVIAGKTELIVTINCVTICIAKYITIHKVIHRFVITDHSYLQAHPIL